VILKDFWVILKGGYPKTLARPERPATNFRGFRF